MIIMVIIKKRKGTTTPVKDKDGKALSIHEKRKKRQKEHFEEILSRTETENH